MLSSIVSSKYILFKSRKLSTSNKDYNIILDDFIIEQVDNTNFFKSNHQHYTLSWQDHLKIVCNKVSKILALSSELEKKYQ